MPYFTVVYVETLSLVSSLVRYVISKGGTSKSELQWSVLQSIVLKSSELQMCVLQ